MELAAEVELIELIGSELDRLQQGWDAAKDEIDRLQDELAKVSSQRDEVIADYNKAVGENITRLERAEKELARVTAERDEARDLVTELREKVAREIDEGRTAMGN